MSRSQHPRDPVAIPVDLWAEAVVFWTLVLIPLWWWLGIQLLVYPLMGWILLLRAVRRPVVVAVPFGWQLWGLYSAVWLISLMVNLAIGTAEIGRSVTALGSIFGIWFLTLIVWYAMRRLGVRLRVVVRAICIVGFCQLLAIGIGETYLRATGHILETQSLLVTLVPSLPARLFFEARLYGLDKLGWDVDRVPRLLSFYYWSPLAGTMSILIGMASLMETNRFLKVASLFGALLTIWYAAARAGQVGVVIALLIALWFGKGLGRRILQWGLIPLAFASPLILARLYSYFFEYRSDSTSGRLALYRETYEAFQNSPLIGFGTYGRAQSLDVPLGSHSQILSTLYHTGFLGMVILLIAWLALTITVGRLVLKHPLLAPILGAWVGLSLQMMTGELSGASVTVFTLATLLGCTWNLAEDLTRHQQMPWLNAVAQMDSPTPWYRVGTWWQGTSTVQILRPSSVSFYPPRDDP